MECNFKGAKKEVVWKEDKIEDVMGEPIWIVEDKRLREERAEAGKRAVQML